MSETTQVRERPILFSDRLVRAILDGRKTQTRRVVKGVGNDNCLPMGPGLKTHVLDAPERGLCPYGGPGDRLYVREAWHSVHDYREEWVRRQHLDPSLPSMIDYRATHRGDLKWRPSIHMPKWASRITLEVTGVRVERLQEITEEDAEAEGVPGFCCNPTQWSPCGCGGSTARDQFRELWDEYNAPRGYSWDANPWLWVIEFRRVAP